MSDHTIEFELKRQAIHMFLGAAILAILFLLPFSASDALAYAQAFALTVLVYLLVVIDRRAKGSRSPLTDYLIDSLERKGAPPAHGALWYVLGALLAMTFIAGVNKIAAAIFLLAIADAISTLAGVKGKHFLPYNRRKTVEGTLAFFVTGLATAVFIGPTAVLLSALAALVESADLHLDDNLTIPLTCVVFFKLAGV